MQDAGKIEVMRDGCKPGRRGVDGRRVAAEEREGSSWSDRGGTTIGEGRLSEGMRRGGGSRRWGIGEEDKVGRGGGDVGRGGEMWNGT